MPRIISDELFEGLMRCIKDQRLLGVMGLLERCQREAEVAMLRDEWLAESETIIVSSYESFRRLEDGPKTNNN